MMYWLILYNGAIIFDDDMPVSPTGDDHFLQMWGVMPLCHDDEGY